MFIIHFWYSILKYFWNRTSKYLQSCLCIALYVLSVVILIMPLLLDSTYHLSDWLFWVLWLITIPSAWETYKLAAEVHIVLSYNAYLRHCGDERRLNIIAFVSNKEIHNDIVVTHFNYLDPSTVLNKYGVTHTELDRR